jgi:glycosyltransferase involved in cell wall biosynthesis
MTWLVLAGGPRAAAERFAVSRSPSSRVVGRDEIRGALGRREWRTFCGGFDGVAIHTPDWRRQRAPQLYELAAALAPVRHRVLADDAAGVVRTLGTAELASRVAVIPFALASALLQSAGEVARSSRRDAGTARHRAHRNRSVDPAVLALWTGDTGVEVGGSVTHAAGILGGFRHAGWRVGVVSLGPLPEQLAAAADDVQIARPLSPGARVTSDVEGLAANRVLRRAAKRMAERLQPAIVYQRHRALLTAGFDVASSVGAELVLEWNSSELWARANWGEPSGLSRVFDRLVRTTETSAVTGADLVVSVSAAAAEAALEAGAISERVVVVPNGVDVEEVDRALERGDVRDRDDSAPQIGWIGSFDLFHGVEELVRGIALTPANVRCVLIGDGPRRVPSEELARELGVTDRIEWTGALPHAEALVRLAGCDVLLSPHPPLADRDFFGSPTKIFEYMALGRPIVASALGQIAEVLQDGANARLVTPGDPVSLAEGIRDVLSSPDRGKALGDAARRDALSRHTWDARAADILNRLNPE